MLEMPERFVVGSDTWINARWDDYEALMQQARRWLGDLPPAVARRIAWDNGARCSACRRPERSPGPRPSDSGETPLKHGRRRWNAAATPR